MSACSCPGDCTCRSVILPGAPIDFTSLTQNQIDDLCAIVATCGLDTDTAGTVLAATAALTTTNGVAVPVGGFYALFPDGTTWADADGQTVEVGCAVPASQAIGLDGVQRAGTNLWDLPGGIVVDIGNHTTQSIDTFGILYIGGTAETMSVTFPAPVSNLIVRLNDYDGFAENIQNWTADGVPVTPTLGTGAVTNGSGVFATAPNNGTGEFIFPGPLTEIAWVSSIGGGGARFVGVEADGDLFDAYVYQNPDGTEEIRDRLTDAVVPGATMTPCPVTVEQLPPEALADTFGTVTTNNTGDITTTNGVLVPQGEPFVQFPDGTTWAADAAETICPAVGGSGMFEPLTADATLAEVDTFTQATGASTASDDGAGNVRFSMVNALDPATTRWDFAGPVDIVVTNSPSPNQSAVWHDVPGFGVPRTEMRTDSTDPWVYTPGSAPAVIDVATPGVASGVDAGGVLDDTDWGTLTISGVTWLEVDWLAQERFNITVRASNAIPAGTPCEQIAAFYSLVESGAFDTDTDSFGQVTTSVLAVTTTNGVTVPAGDPFVLFPNGDTWASAAVTADTFGTVQTATAAFTTSNGVDIAIGDAYIEFPNGQTWDAPTTAVPDTGFIVSTGPDGVVANATQTAVIDTDQNNENLHFFSSDDSINFSVTEGSAIVDITKAADCCLVLVDEQCFECEPNWVPFPNYANNTPLPNTGLFADGETSYTISTNPDTLNEIRRRGGSEFELRGASATENFHRFTTFEFSKPIHVRVGPTVLRSYGVAWEGSATGISSWSVESGTDWDYTPGADAAAVVVSGKTIESNPANIGQYNTNSPWGSAEAMADRLVYQSWNREGFNLEVALPCTIQVRTFRDVETGALRYFYSENGSDTMTEFDGTPLPEWTTECRADATEVDLLNFNGVFPTSVTTVEEALEYLSNNSGGSDTFGTVATAPLALVTTNGVTVTAGEPYVSFPDGTSWAAPASTGGTDDQNATEVLITDPGDEFPATVTTVEEALAWLADRLYQRHAGQARFSAPSNGGGTGTLLTPDTDQRSTSLSGFTSTFWAPFSSVGGVKPGYLYRAHIHGIAEPGQSGTLGVVEIFDQGTIHGSITVLPDQTFAGEIMFEAVDGSALAFIVESGTINVLASASQVTFEEIGPAL